MPIFNDSNKNKSLELVGVTLIPIVKIRPIVKILFKYYYFEVSYIEHTTVDLQRQDLSIDTLFVASSANPSQIAEFISDWTKRPKGYVN